MTLNTHSLHGEEASENIDRLCEFLGNELPDVIALQEVNQTESEEAADTDHTDGFYRIATCESPVPLKRDNFVLELWWRLSQRGIVYHFCWLPVKRGYGCFDEGLAFLSREPIESACGFYISRGKDYNDWKTRMALLMKQKGSPYTFCDLHTSRYDDRDDPFYEQWKRFIKRIPERENTVLLGDFNCPAEIRGEGYDRICESGYFDMYRLSDEREGGKETVYGGIDGWYDGALGDGGRIDYIFTGFYPKAKRISYRRVLDGERGERVSDHFGVVVNFEGLEQEAK